MSFASPWLLVLALIPLAALLLQHLPRRGGDDRDVLPAVLRGFAAGGHVRIGAATPRWPWRFWLAVLLLVLALARPQWGVQPDESNKRDQVVIALDLSRSMLAADALPSRIERARAIAQHFVAQSPTAEIGLIAFAGQAYPLAAPSADRALLLTFLPQVAPDQMVVPGSNFASMLDVALRAFDAKAASRTLVLLSDGEAEPTPWQQAVPALRARDIHVVAVGIGTAAGARIIVGGRDLVAPDGAVVTSRLQPDALRAIASMSGGTYLEAAGSAGLAARVRAIADHASGRRTARPGAAREERFGWFLLPSLMLLLWSALAEWPAIPRLLRARRRATKPAAYAAAAILAMLATSPRGRALKPAEPDPLAHVKSIVRQALAERQPTAADYMALAQAAVRYAEDRRQHLHPLQQGVMRDGLAAVDTGQALEPGRPGWGPLRAKLVDLLKPPRTADDPEAGDGAISKDPVDPDTPKPDEAGSKPDAKPQPDTRSVGGPKRSRSVQAEWQVPSLVKPLYVLQKLRAADRPGDLFRLMQRQEPVPPRRTEQTW
ncbi:VWA domain-containing protein [Sphingomonas sp. MMS24-J13]|uniref:VWA domain-containing protein n=1 Tax=Sphingomonas sp. MMS24-J13 TaxID=3238686 RepID=UPI00384EE800